VLALSGLALACHQYASGLEKQELQLANQNSEHISHSHWLMLVMDSLMSLVDFTFSPKAGLLGLSQQVDSIFYYKTKPCLPLLHRSLIWLSLIDICHKKDILKYFKPPTFEPQYIHVAILFCHSAVSR